MPDAGDAYTEYPDQRRDDWATKVLPILKAMTMRELLEKSGLDRRTLQRIQRGVNPHASNKVRLRRIIAP